MNLFHETESKYYELLSYMINDKEAYSAKEVAEYTEKYLIGETDYDVIEELFLSKEDSETVFSLIDGKYYPVIPGHFPVRLNQVEALAAKSMANNRYAKHFLTAGTIEKLQHASDCIPELWDINEIQIKNQYQYGDIEADVTYEQTLNLIAEAIRNHKAITYDNILPGKYEYVEITAFPIKIEYSFLNDIFRVSVYDEKQDRFIKLNLSTMKNVKQSDETTEDLTKEYQDFIEMNTKKIELDVDPIDHVIERCFRIFSYYDRQARFDKEENKYKLTISYLKQDENEVIRDIMSLGSYVVVMSPKRIQKEVYKRIVAARDNYKI